MLKPWMLSITTNFTRFGGVGVLRTIYYLLIIAGLIWLYGRGDFTPPKFVYQGF
ncbi:MAG: teichoic acid D-Ala incorporation-associated protein DltX [Caldilineaceae bacterium]